jgi:hypothetical protein
MFKLLQRDADAYAEGRAPEVELDHVLRDGEKEVGAEGHFPALAIARLGWWVSQPCGL